MQQLLIEIRRSLNAILALGVLLCGFYPSATWVVGRTCFADKANGSLLVREGKMLGSLLIGRDFAGKGYFHPRPSAAGSGYDAAVSGGSNLGPISRQLITTVERRAQEYRRENNLSADYLVPADAVTASASGLDPHISVENALLQCKRVALARGMSDEGIRRRIAENTEGRTFGVFGEPRVNVLKLNLTLDGRLRP